MYGVKHLNIQIEYHILKINILSCPNMNFLGGNAKFNIETTASYW